MHFLRTPPSIRLPYSCDSRSAQGDTYDRVSETRKERGLQQRAQLLLELERQMSHKERTSELNFPRWLHFVRRQDAEDAEDDDFCKGAEPVSPIVKSEFGHSTLGDSSTSTCRGLTSLR